MANTPNGLKGNPASNRMSNPNRKARRARCWARGEKRKAQRREDQARREAANKILWASILGL
jgi:hypothetical protein